jgi:FAD/FMN-containing dehydrogenase
MSYWFTTQSRWLPIRLFQPNYCKQLANTIFQASREWEFAIQFSKGLAGSSPEAAQRSKDSSINPVCLDSAALAVFGAVKHPFYPWQQLSDSDREQGLQQVQKVNAAMKILTDATPDSGAYSNEADYFQENWQKAFWGDNYPRLLEIKNKYDPNHFFQTHHSIGTE